MHFASPFPLWVAAMLAAAMVALSVFAYRRPLVPLTRAQHATLVALRAFSLLTLLFFLCRPIVLAPPDARSDVPLPILIDASRSMSVDDAGNGSRIARALEIVNRELLPAIGTRFKPEIYTFGSALVPAAETEGIHADASSSDIVGALAAARDRYRGRSVPGMVVVSDGGDTGHADPGRLDTAIFAIGVGSPEGPADREVTGITAGDPRLEDAMVDVHVTAVSRGFGRAPFDLRVSANGRLIDTRRIVPAGDGSPIEETFTIAPDARVPTVVTAEIPAGAGERVADNNVRATLVNPPGRKRRVLMIEGAPGFEHSFLTRALAADPNLDVDVIARKGKNDAGQDTYFVQAGEGRAPSLTSGFPARREDLFGYDAVLLGNVANDLLSREQMSLLADFVSVRGGGLLVFGGASFAGRGFSGTPLEPIVPVELSDRRAPLSSSALGIASALLPGMVAPTADGVAHPVVRLGATPEETRDKWAALPALAGAAALGAPKPGARVLAVTSVAGGAVYPVVAVQPYGAGRSMVFGGEGSWRWQMLLPASNRTYEFFWRQAARWLAAASPDPVALSTSDQPQPGEAVTISAKVRDTAFAAVAGAKVSGRVSAPNAVEDPLTFHRDSDGTFSASFVPASKGIYQVHVDAAAAAPLGSADRWLYAGGADREMADPRLDERTLRRIARASGGAYVAASEAGGIRRWLDQRSIAAADLEPRDWWQQPWLLALAIAALSAEWMLRRRWGLR
jgi:hypothetical protein